jgi:transcriptional regulator with XRE-family HTH domain
VTTEDLTMDGEVEREAVSDSQTRESSGPQIVGSRVREERLRQKIGVRELARRVGVSASLISQVELGKASPSVGTLYAIVNELGISLDELFFEQPTIREPLARTEPEVLAIPPALQPALQPSGDHDHQHGRIAPVVRRGEGKVIQLASGIQWERLTPESPQDVDFLFVAYEVGSESCPPDSLMRHSGSEYGHVIDGRLGITIGFETYELGPGDSVSFESTMPHRLFTIGDQQVRAIWFVVGRRGDPRIVRNVTGGG